MQPVSPVIEGHEAYESTACAPEVCKHEPKHIPLPVYYGADGFILTRWRLNDEDKMRALEGADIYFWLRTGGTVPPMLVTFEKPVAG